MAYEEWLAQVPDSLKNDPIWKFEACLKVLLLYDLAWEDTDKLLKDVRGRKLAGRNRSGGRVQRRSSRSEATYRDQVGCP